jgi:hypothetical protein
MVVGYVDVGDRGEDSGRSPVKATRLIVAVAPPLVEKKYPQKTASTCAKTMSPKRAPGSE